MWKWWLNIKSRDEILAFFFSILALNFLWNYLKKENFKWMLAAVLSYGIAMFSKEGVITFLAIFPLTIYFFRPSTSVRKILITTALLAIPAVLYLFVRSNILGAVGSGGRRWIPAGQCALCCSGYGCPFGYCFFGFG